MFVESFVCQQFVDKWENEGMELVASGWGVCDDHG